MFYTSPLLSIGSGASVGMIVEAVEVPDEEDEELLGSDLNSVTGK